MGGGRLLDRSSELSDLSSNSLFLSDSVLGSSGLSLLLELGLKFLLVLGLVDGFNQDGFVLVQVTLAGKIEVVITKRDIVRDCDNIFNLIFNINQSQWSVSV